MNTAAMTDRELRLKSIRYRRDLLRFIHHAGAGHTGGSLSCVDILNVLYNRVLRVSPETFGDPNRDRYVQSKGHSVEALYVVLADCGFFPQSELETLCRYRSPFVGHPTRKVPGIEMNTGALGHGLPIAWAWRWRGSSMLRRIACSRCWATANWPRVRTGRRRWRPPITGSIT